MPLPNSLRSSSAQPEEEQPLAPLSDAPAQGAAHVSEPLLAPISEHVSAEPGPDAPTSDAALEEAVDPSEPNEMKHDADQRLEALERAIRGVETRTQEIIDLLKTPQESPQAETEDSPLADLSKAVEELGAKVDRNDRQLTQDLRENANFRIQVRQGMQHDIDELRAQQRGETLNPILREVAEAYCDYYVLLEESLTERGRRNLEALFDQLEEILNDNGAEIIMTEIGEERNLRTSKIIEKIPTGDERLHNHVALSRKPGAVRDRLVLRQEMVDVYVYDPALAVPPAVEEENADGASVEPSAPEETAAPEEMPVADPPAPTDKAETVPEA